MKKTRKPILLILMFGVLLAGSVMLYDRLGAENAPDQLAVHQSQPSTDNRETSENTENTTSHTVAADNQTETTEVSLPLAPDFTVYDQEGNEVRLSDFIGKPVVLNFWASWCGPCQMEMPDFEAKYQELGDEIHFLMINMTDGSRETVETASAFIAQKGYTFPVYYDTQYSAASTYGVYYLPTTYFIDAQGHAIAQATSAIDAATLQRGIDLIT